VHTLAAKKFFFQSTRIQLSIQPQSTRRCGDIGRVTSEHRPSICSLLLRKKTGVISHETPYDFSPKSKVRN